MRLIVIAVPVRSSTRNSCSLMVRSMTSLLSDICEPTDERALVVASIQAQAGVSCSTAVRRPNAAARFSKRRLEIKSGDIPTLLSGYNGSPLSREKSPRVPVRV